jgi:hypothetical protein
VVLLEEGSHVVCLRDAFFLIIAGPSYWLVSFEVLGQVPYILTHRHASEKLFNAHEGIERQSLAYDRVLAV